MCIYSGQEKKVYTPGGVNKFFLWIMRKLFFAQIVSPLLMEICSPPLERHYYEIFCTLHMYIKRPAEKTADFFSRLGPSSFNLLTVTFQGQFFL